MIIVDKERFRINTSVLINYLVAIFRQLVKQLLFREAFKISNSRVTFLTSSRLTFSKKNLQPEFSSFILTMLECFSKLLFAFSIGTLCSLEISQRLMLRPSTVPSKYDRKISATSFSSEKLYHFQQILFFHLLVSFQ